MVSISDILLACTSFAPAVLLMYLTLKDYTAPKVEKPFFDDRRVFMFFAIGIVIGMIFFFVDSAVGYSIDMLTIVLIPVAVSTFQGLTKLMILNWPKLQRKVDTAFYALALGLGISATYSFSRMFIIANNPGVAGLGGADIFTLLFIGMMGVQIVLIQGSTTAMIGVGCARGTPWSYFAYSMMYALGYSLLLYGSAIAADQAGDVAGVGVLMAAWLVCVYSYWHVYVIDFPNLIDDAKRGMKKAKKLRKN